MVAGFGVFVLLLGFGARFGYPVLGRLARAVGRALDVLDKDKPPVVAAQLHGRVVAMVAFVILMVGIVMWVMWYLPRRRDGGGGDGDGGSEPPPDDDLPAY
jgi:hypothetical protein